MSRSMGGGNLYTDIELTIHPGCFLPIWSVHPTIISVGEHLRTEGAEQAGRVCGGGQRRHPGESVKDPIRNLKVTVEVSIFLHEGPRSKLESIFTSGDDGNIDISFNDVKYSEINDYLILTGTYGCDDDDIKDGIEDVNQNGRIDGDNGDGSYQMESERWKETNPNNNDTDSDTIYDNKEKEFKYNPLKQDTDGDGLTDIEEDKNKNGKYDPENGETNALEIDTDKDGMQDKLELDGWTVCIRFGSTKEELTNYKVSSDPRIPDTDSDKVPDFDEYKNTTDPNKPDTDGDGRSDWMELNYNMSSTPTEIDGNPPDINEFNSYYDVTYEKYLGVKLPNGIKLCINMRVTDMFGVYGVQVTIAGLGQQSVFTNNLTNVSVDFEWKVSGWDNIKKTIWEGFKINITAMDQNRNFGYKEEEQPGIAMLIVSAILGPLLAFVKFIAELASGVFNWVYDAIKNLFTTILDKIDELISTITEFFMEQVRFFRQADVLSSIFGIFLGILKIFDHPIMWVLTGLEIIFNVVLVIVSSVPITAIISIAITLIITILMIIIKSAQGDEEDDNFISKKIRETFLLDYEEESKGDNIGEDAQKASGTVSSWTTVIDFIGTIIGALADFDEAKPKVDPDDMSKLKKLIWKIPWGVWWTISLVLMILGAGNDLYSETTGLIDVVEGIGLLLISGACIILGIIKFSMAQTMHPFWKGLGIGLMIANIVSWVLSFVAIIFSPGWKRPWKVESQYDNNPIDDPDDDNDPLKPDREKRGDVEVTFRLHTYSTIKEPVGGADSSAPFGLKTADVWVKQFSVFKESIKTNYLIDENSRTTKTNIGFFDTWYYSEDDIIQYTLKVIDEDAPGEDNNPGDDPITLYRTQNEINIFYRVSDQHVFIDDGDGVFEEDQDEDMGVSENYYIGGVSGLIIGTIGFSITKS